MPENQIEPRTVARGAPQSRRGVHRGYQLQSKHGLLARNALALLRSRLALRFNGGSGFCLQLCGYRVRGCACQRLTSASVGIELWAPTRLTEIEAAS